MSVPILFAALSAAQAAPEECSFTDVVSWEVRACEEGPSEKARKFLVEDEYGELSFAEEYANLRVLFDLSEQESVVDHGDPVYDATDEEKNALQKLFDSLWDLLRILVALAGGYEDYLEDIGLTGPYDGTLYHGSESAPAYLELRHVGSSVDGTLYVGGPDLTLDGGICGEFAVPMAAIPVHATSASSRQASGSTQRSVDLGLFSGTLDVDFWFELNSNHERLSGAIWLDAPFPCSNDTVFFSFLRRNDELF